MGKTVIVSSHLLSEIELVANRMIIIHKGKKIAEGDVSEMLDPSNTVVLVETTDNTKATSLLSAMPGIHLTHTTDDRYIHISLDKNDIPQTVTQLTSAGVGILSLRPRHSLEEYFLSLTNNTTHVETFTNRTV